jgi:Ca2+-binding EF-hand superfamily protein
MPQMNEMHQELNEQYNQMPNPEPMQFSDEEIQNLREIFDLFDKGN